MNEKSKLVPVLLSLSLLFLVLIFVIKNRNAGPDQSIPEDKALITAPSPEPSSLQDGPVSVRDQDAAVESPQSGELVDPVLIREEQFEITEADMTPFLDSDIAKKWKKELGYTDSEFVQAQREIRAQGGSEDRVNDPGVIMRTLPTRHVGRITVSEIIVPEEANAGEAIPFTLRGTKPSPSFSFTKFDILVQGETIRINAKGNSDGDNEAGLGGPVELKGEIDPLPAPGEYRVVVPELGPKGDYRIVVK